MLCMSCYIAIYLSIILYAIANEEPTMKHLQMWSKNSILRTQWHDFAVELVGMTDTEVIRAKFYGGGSHSCLQRMLATWYNSTTSTDRRWQVIIDALTDMKKLPVVESIEKECLTCS